MPEHKLEEIIKRLYCDAVLVGVGNELSADDAFGPVLVQKIKSFFGYHAIDAGLAPENWTSPIVRIRPRLVVIADAICFGGFPGEIKIFDANELDSGLPSTHGPGLNMFIEYLKNALPDVKFLLLAVQPEKTGFGKPMSEPVKMAIEEIMSVVKSTPPEIMRP